MTAHLRFDPVERMHASVRAVELALADLRRAFDAADALAFEDAAAAVQRAWEDVDTDIHAKVLREMERADEARRYPRAEPNATGFGGTL